ncbi:MAG TPA: alpha/beta fold hydrolase [Trebonia sp.]|jgi:pimeloyl-ACP methyl ester carboxylesterase|nr:alpha/beta fold hydrolase [Trebonia sp.]
MIAEIPLPPGIERRYIDTRRGPVAALHARPDRASGRTSVMVCGFMGTKEDFWQLLPLLARDGYDAWSYDHAGQHGGEFAGSGEDRPERYMTKSMADEGRDVIEAVGRGAPVHLVGHCFGGFVARAMALAAPGLTRSLSLLSCGPNVRSAHARAMVAGIDDLLDRGGAMLLWPLLKRVLHNEDQITRDFWHANLATVNPNYLKGVARSLAQEKDDRSEEVAAAGIRSLVMHGSREKRLWRPEVYADMARLLRADLIVVDKAGHNVYRDQPDVTAANLAAFWARTEAAATPVRVGGGAEAAVS